MAKHFSIRPAAALDLEDSAFYISLDRPDAAERFITSAIKSFEDLAQMPTMGAPYEVSNPQLAGLRKWPIHGFGDFLIFYVEHRGTIEVVRVIHGARDIPRVLDENTE